MNNKILVELYIPIIEKNYDMFVPISKKIGTIKTMIEEELEKNTDGTYKKSERTNLYSKDTGMLYDVNMTVKETDLKNGSRIILI